MHNSKSQRNYAEAQLIKHKHKKIVYRVIIGAIALSLIPAIPGIYDITRPVVKDGYVDTSSYAPFHEHSQVVTLTEPTKDTIRSGEYPITTELYAVTAGSDNPHIVEFIDWILSKQGQEIVEKTGYVSIE